MENSRIITYLVIGVLFLFQCTFIGIKKRKDKNFYEEPKIINLLSLVSSIFLLVFDFLEIWDLSNDGGFIVLVMLLILSAIVLIYRNSLTSKQYTVHNTTKTQLETVLLQTLDNYGLKYKREENAHNSSSDVFIEQHDASIKIKPKRGSSNTFELIFVRFNQVYYYEDVILDLRVCINESTKADRFRGLSELLAATMILVSAAWLYTKIYGLVG